MKYIKKAGNNFTSFLNINQAPLRCYYKKSYIVNNKRYEHG
jgi:hypothetical protein